MSTTNWSAYKPLTDDEQVLFKNLLGKSSGIGEALLVSALSSEKGFTEYIFLYNHPDSEVHNLVSFYAKVEDKKATLLQHATAQLTEKMILKNIKFSADLTDEGYSLTSQATYFFDCENKATIDDETQQIKNINSITSKGSFCCVLKRLNTSGLKKQTDNEVNKAKPGYPEEFENSDFTGEYFILTAAHNLRNGTSKLYKLIKDESNYMNLELIKNYGELTDSEKQENEELKKKKQPLKYFTHDAAILKITTPNITDTVFYKSRKEFDLSEDVPKDDTWIEAGLIGYTSKSKKIKISDKPKDGTPSEFNIDTENSGESGDSGGCVFNLNEQKKLHGVFNGAGPTGGLLYSKIPSISNYKLC